MLNLVIRVFSIAVVAMAGLVFWYSLFHGIDQWMILKGF
jgi:hypothetical protein